MHKTLVAYFSASGTTRQIGQTMAKIMEADVCEIKPKMAYTHADLNWHDPHSRSSVEMKDVHSRPEMADLEVDPSAYDTIYVGFPIWWYEAPRIISTFLESADFKGKTIVIFATSGGSGMGETLHQLKGCCPNANWIEGKVFHAFASKEEVGRWVEEIEKQR